jgi:hypothetical protein
MRVERTQDTLGTLISLDERYLVNPSFRFLREAVVLTTCKTGFATGLYSEEELRASDVADRRRFLEKLATCIGLTLGAQFELEVDEVLAGKAPGAANELLSKLHEATKWPSEQAVLRTRALYPARPASASTASI